MTKKAAIIISSGVAAVALLSVVIVGVLYGNNVIHHNETDGEKHTVIFDTNGGTAIDSVQVTHGDRLKRPDDPFKLGYTATDWQLNGLTWNFDEDVVKQDMTLSLNWELSVYSITYEFAGGTTSESYATSYTIKSEFDLVRPVKTPGVFAGWFSQDKKRIDSIVPGMTGNLDLTARWIENLEAISLDASRGNINVYASEYATDEVTVVNVPVNKKCHVFKGWYDKNNNLLSLDDSYTFKLNQSGMNYIYSKYMDDSEENTWNYDHCISPRLLDTRIGYGLYPQSVVSDLNLITILNGLSPSKYYGSIHYRGDYYVKETAKLARDQNGEVLMVRKFDNGTEIIEGETYWFKFEPIKWKILSDGTTKTLLSDKLLTVKKYNNSGENKTAGGKTIYANNYKESSVRNWLNLDFYSLAFEFNQSPIKQTEIDNSTSSTSVSPNPYSCENTFDKVSLLSYKDYINPAYGFSSSSSSHPTRHFMTTDYARAQKAFYSVINDNIFCGYCWTRSPAVNPTENLGVFISRVNMNGTINFDYLQESQSCVQPCIRIS